MGKFIAYELQNTSFLHVDGDVFVWEKIGFASEDLIVQSKTDFRRHAFYGEIRDVLYNKLSFVPGEIFSQLEASGDIIAINAGIIGGNDIKFLKAYAKRAIDFLDHNLSKRGSIPSQLFNMLFEELFFYCLAKHEKKNVFFLFYQMDKDFSQVLNFHLVPKIQNYIHTVGHAKRNPLACRQVEFRLRYEFPEYYERVLELLGEKKKVPVAFPHRRQELTIFLFHLQSGRYSE